LNSPAGSHHNDSNHSDTNSDIAQPSPHLRVHAALQALKSQHETLVKSLYALSHIDTGSGPSAHASPLPSTAEEEESDHQHAPDLQSSGRFGTPFTRKSTRTSIATTFSEGTTSREWFDASDGGEEFFLDEPTPMDEKADVETELVEGSRSSLGGSSDVEEDTVVTEVQDKGGEVVKMVLVQKARRVVRRTELPCGPVGDEGSLFALLKKNVGKVRCLLHLYSRLQLNVPPGPCKCHFPCIIQ
jgi:oxysterol-binding protein-related protein 3/6/7